MKAEVGKKKDDPSQDLTHPSSLILHPSEILDLLGKLVDKSLVWVDQGLGAEARYRMLETIRQYAHEKLHEMGGEAAVRDRHLVYFLGMAEGAEPRSRHEDGAIWMDRLEMELDNLRLALEWSLAGGFAGGSGETSGFTPGTPEEGRPAVGETQAGSVPSGDGRAGMEGIQAARVEAGMRLAGAMMWFWHIRSHGREGVDWLERLLAAETSHSASEPAPRPGTPPAGEWREPEKTAPGSSSGNASQDNWQGQQAQPGVEALAGLAGMNGLLGLASRRLARAKALKAAAVIYEINLQARSEHSQGMLEESIALCRGLGPAGRHELAVSLEHLGWTLADQERGLAMLEESLEIFRDEQDLFYIAESLHHLSNMVAGQGDHQQARVYLEESLALRRRIHDWDGMGFCLLFMGQLALYHGNYDRAATLITESQACYRQAGNLARLSNAWGIYSWLALAQGNYAEAAQRGEEALSISREIDSPPDETFALNMLGLLAWDQGDYERAQALSQEALAMAKENDSEMSSIFALHVLSRVALTKGDYEKAGEFLVPMMEAARLGGDRADITHALDNLAILAAARQQPDRAATIFAANQDWYRRVERSMTSRERAEHDAWLSAAQQALSEEAFSSAWAAGQALTMEQAIAYALRGEEK